MEAESASQDFISLSSARGGTQRLGGCDREYEWIADGGGNLQFDGFWGMRGQCQRFWSSWRTPGLERCRVGSCWRGGPDLEEEDLEAFSLRVWEEVEEGPGPSSSEEEDEPGPL